MISTKIRVTIGGGGTVSHEHGTGCQLLCAIVSPDPDDTGSEGDGPTFAEVIWNAGKSFTVRGVAGAKQIVTCIPSSSGPAPDDSAAPVFS
jgi:hypothetical protein